ncbi:MAG: STE24 endopeptidase [Gammaproteobacteria bacterium]|jgi:STE24 endopeptidase
MNLFSFTFLTLLFCSLTLQFYLIYRHIRHVGLHRERVPEEFSENISLDAHQKAADYTQAKSRIGIVDLILSSALLLIWTLGGGFNFIDQFIRGMTTSELWTGVCFMLSVLILSSLLDIPMSIYRTFILEEKFGFNKTTPKIFISDMVKSFVLMIIIGTPMLALILWIMTNAGDQWWLYVWMTWLGFSLFMMWFYPEFIAPMFNKFKPLEDQELKSRIENLLVRNGFASQGIFIMDGSSRSSHGNAYFTGMGSNKRIVFFDTLINDLSHQEIEAVLAHELGHFKCNHIKKRISVMAIIFLVGFWILGWLIDKQWFYSGLGVDQASNYMALILFMMALPVFTFFLQPISSYFSRRDEFEADDFAAEQAHASDLIKALVKLYKENANTLTPDPLYSAFHDSHPPAPIRIAHLTEKPV